MWRRFRYRKCCDFYEINLLTRTLFYNQLTSFDVFVDTFFEPFYWFVDNYIKYLGPFFVILVICMIVSIVFIFYACLLPYKYAENYFRTFYHLIIGHWLLVNVTFHYFKAIFTNPGEPPDCIPETVSICKKCINPKPPRTHHCSICNRCILKMDHHCPWLNNCVGNYNHRHFFQFMVFMWMGSCYVSWCAYPVFKEHFLGSTEIGVTGYIFPIYFVKEKIWKPYFVKSKPFNDTNTNDLVNPSQFLFHNMILHEFMLSSIIVIGLSLLTLWHTKLIHYGETSIEAHINKKERLRLKKLGLVHRNPYNFGYKENWRSFFNLREGRTFWRHVLFPSSHGPESKGLHFKNNVYDSSIMLI